VKTWRLWGMAINLQKEIRNKAFSIFRAWTKVASSRFPNIDFTIKDETHLVNDFEEALQKAVKSLAEKRKENKNYDAEFEYGYFIGFIQGNLDSLWVNEYIAKHSPEYRNYMACKAILEFMRFDTLTGTRINKLYEAIMVSGTNLQNVDSKISELKIDKYQLDEVSAGKQYLEKSSPVYTYLENQLSKHIVAFMDKHNVHIMPRLESFFDRNFVTQILIHYEN
jgi:hypothetical protein